MSISPRVCWRWIRFTCCGGFNIQCDHKTEARRPDIVILGEEDRVCKIIDFAVPVGCKLLNTWYKVLNKSLQNIGKGKTRAEDGITRNCKNTTKSP